MLSFLFQQIALHLSVAVVLFLPGYALLALLGGKKRFAALEAFILSFGLSIVVVDILMILMGQAGLALTRLSILAALVLFCAGAFLLAKKYPLRITEPSDRKIISFSFRETLLVMALLFLSIFIRTAYLSKAVAPTATDLGHHMYWTKQIAETGKLPVYQKTDIIEKDGNYTIAEPKLIDDFIIGEHLPFAALALVAGADVVSSFPVLVLFLINIMGILALFLLALVLFERIPHGKNAAFFTLFLIGPIYALSASQGNFVSGGVVGNLLGNLLIPTTLYFILRAREEKNPLLLATGILVAFGLGYTHHLSMFIFLFLAAFTGFFFALFHGKDLFKELAVWVKLALSPAVLFFLSFAAVFFFFILTPSYIANKAVETIIGAPSRSTKEGLPLTQLMFTVGQARAALGLAGAFIALAFFRKHRLASALLLGWSGAIFIMSWKPTLLHIDIPSVRIATYLVYPLVLLGAFAAAWLFAAFQKKDSSRERFMNNKLFMASIAVLLIFATTSGFRDNAEALKDEPNTDDMVQTFNASRYLAARAGVEDVILKDHNYVPADSWMKLFFMRDYNFPFTRSFFFRYEGAKKREQCTLFMISEPSSNEAQKCYRETGTDFIVVNPSNDGPQFEGRDFWKIYASGNIAAFYRPQK